MDGLGLPDLLDPTKGDYADSKYCYDSPGTVSRDQIINLLTAEEISLTLASRPLHPRTFNLKLNQSLLLGGLARLDYLEGPEEREHHPLLVTVFCSALLPVNIVMTRAADVFLVAAAGSKLVKVPSGVEERGGAVLPALLGRQVTVEGAARVGADWYHGARDIVLSSAGWVMVSCREGERNIFLACTPEGRGVSCREPFLPYSVSMRGKRVQGTAKYRSDYFLGVNKK